jgi:catalase
MSRFKQGLSRRNMLGRLSVAGMIAPAVASSAFAAPVFMDERKSPTAECEASDAKDKATAEKVVNALEGAYGVNTGQRRNHTKGTGALGSFVGMPAAAEY